MPKKSSHYFPLRNTQRFFPHKLNIIPKNCWFSPGGGEAGEGVVISEAALISKFSLQWVSFRSSGIRPRTMTRVFFRTPFPQHVAFLAGCTPDILRISRCGIINPTQFSSSTAPLLIVTFFFTLHLKFMSSKNIHLKPVLFSSCFFVSSWCFHKKGFQNNKIFIMLI